MVLPKAGRDRHKICDKTTESEVAPAYLLSTI